MKPYIREMSSNSPRGCTVVFGSHPSAALEVRSFRPFGYGHSFVETCSEAKYCLNACARCRNINDPNVVNEIAVRSQSRGDLFRKLFDSGLTPCDVTPCDVPFIVGGGRGHGREEVCSFMRGRPPTRCNMIYPSTGSFSATTEWSKAHIKSNLLFPTKLQPNLNLIPPRDVVIY